jgi:lipoate-protein ligase A
MDAEPKHGARRRQVEGAFHFFKTGPMPKILSRLQLWEDSSPRTPAGQMACDEALLHFCEMPVLRVYRWTAPAVTFGYAQRLAAVEPLAHRLPVMRRWSGGGMVFHGSDVTLALVIPASEAAASGSSRDIYSAIHEGLLSAIQKTLPDARLVLPEECRCGPVCFESPVAFDIIAGASKICGGALRRSKAGVLYQGSLHLPGAVPLELANSLSAEVSRFENSTSLEPLIADLSSSKYETPAWLAMR